MLDQGRAELRRATLEHRKDAERQRKFLERVKHRMREQFGRAGMRRMTFHNSRASRRQRRGGVAATNGEGEGKVAGAENHDRPAWAQHAAKIRLWRGGAVRIGR